MAPIKFEDKLKDKLENRSLQPSSDAWSTLAERLDKEDKKSSSTRFWWLGIAASLVGVILVTTQFYKNTSAVKELPVVVDTKTDVQNNSKLITEPINIDKVLETSELEKEIIDKTTTNSTAVASVSEKKSETENPVLKKKVLLQLEESNEVVAALQQSKNEINDNSLVKVLSLEELKINEVVAEIKQLKASESSVTNKEIDSLLKQAQREIFKQRVYDETTNTVNAEALLQDVEVELEDSFRDKVFEALKSSFISVKTAVAERRN